MDGAAVVGDDLLDVGESEAESLDVVHIACVYTVELFEYLLQVVALDADAVVLQRDAEPVGLVPGRYGEFQLCVLTAVFHGVVHEVEDDVGQVHLVDHHVGTLGAQVGDDLSAVLLDLQREGVDDARDEFVHVDLRHVEVSLLVLVHAELQHLLHLEPQALRLVVDGRCQAAQHLGRTN